MSAAAGWLTTAPRPGVMPRESRPCPGALRHRGHAPRSLAVERPHIVVVDDEVEIRDMLQEYLELNGLRVTCADGTVVRPG